MDDALHRYRYYVRLKAVGPDRIAVVRAVREAFPLMSIQDVVALLGRGCPTTVVEGTDQQFAKNLGQRLTEAGANVEVDYERIAGVDYV